MSLPGDHGLFTTNLGDLNEDEDEDICASYRTCSLYDTSPISKLPNEILSTVFLMNLEKPRVFSLLGCEPSESTISASQVCRHWRAVALNCAILWISIMDFGSESREWVQELLSRTKQVPFNFGSSVAACPPWNLDLVLDLSPRWKTLHIYIKNVTEELLYAIQQPAPSLEMFGITFHDNEDVTTLPTMLFNGTAPQLRKIRLSRCYFDTSTSVFSQLTSLEVLWDGGFAGPTVLEWLNLLNDIPQLENLRILRAFSISTTTEPLPRVKLPQLSDLSVGAPLAECSRFLSHIDIPPLTRLFLTTYELRPHPDFQVVLKFLEERIDGWTRDAAHDKCHAFFEPHSFRINISTAFPEGPSESNIQVTFDWEGFTGNELRDTTFLFGHPFIGLFSPLFYNARSLHVYYQDDGAMDSVRTMTLLAVSFLHPFDNLVTLHLLGNVHMSIFPFLELIHMVCEDSSGTKAGLMLPSLRVLEFTACDFKSNNEHGLNTLRAFLKFRSDNGIKIEKIKFVHCYLDEGQENGLKEFGIDISSFQQLQDFQFE